MFLCDAVYTHFEREEDVNTLNGKLKEDLCRIHQIIEEATADSIIIMNEIFSSTTLYDAVFLGNKIVENILKKGSLCVYVTFLEELSNSEDRQSVWSVWLIGITTMSGHTK